MQPSEILIRLKELQGERNNIDGLYDLIQRYVRPMTGDFYNKNMGELGKDWGDRGVYDSTAVIACGQLASSIHGSLTPPLVKWLNIVFRDEDLNKNHEAAEWLESCSNLCYQALQASDFHLECQKTYLDIASWGMSFILEEEEGDATGIINFTTCPVKSSYYEAGKDGQPRAFYRELNWTASQCVDKFGDNCPEYIRQKWMDGKVTDTEEIIFAVWKRDDAPELDKSMPIAPELREWGYAYVCAKTKELIGEEGGYYERPVFAPKWLETSDSKFGISPAAKAMSDIQSLNQLVKMILTAAEKAIDPPMKVEEAGIFGDIDMSAGGITVVRDMDAIQTLDNNMKFDVSQLTRGELTQSIRSAFHADDLQLKESPAMTATETMARVELMQRVLGATFGYLKSYMLDPIVQRTFNILIRAGKMPEVPESVKNSSSQLEIEYLGTMARAQKSDSVTSIVGMLGDIAQLGEAFPEALDIVDVDASIRYMADARNLPKNLLRGEQEVQDSRKAKQQQIDNREQLEQDEIASKTMGNAEQMMAAKRQMDLPNE